MAKKRDGEKEKLLLQHLQREQALQDALKFLEAKPAALELPDKNVETIKPEEKPKRKTKAKIK